MAYAIASPWVSYLGKPEERQATNNLMRHESAIVKQWQRTLLRLLDSVSSGDGEVSKANPPTLQRSSHLRAYPSTSLSP